MYWASMRRWAARDVSVGRRKIAKKIAKNKRCYANNLRPRSRMLLKGDEGGLGGHYPPGSSFRAATAPKRHQMKLIEKRRPAVEVKPASSGNNRHTYLTVNRRSTNDRTGVISTFRVSQHPPSKAYRKGLSSPLPLARLNGVPCEGSRVRRRPWPQPEAGAVFQSLDMVEWLTVGLCLIEGSPAAY
jgi:hypothetical protein